MINFKVLASLMTKQELELYLNRHPSYRLPTDKEFKKFMATENNGQIESFAPVFLSFDSDLDTHYTIISAKNGIEKYNRLCKANVLLVEKDYDDTFLNVVMLTIFAFIIIYGFKIFTKEEPQGPYLSTLNTQHAAISQHLIEQKEQS